MRNMAYKYRIYPDRNQQTLLSRTFGCCRFVYNRMLSDKKAAYEKEGKIPQITPARYKKEYEWLKEVDSLALANTQLHLEAAFRRYTWRQHSEGTLIRPRTVFRSSSPNTAADRATQRTW